MNSPLENYLLKINSPAGKVLDEIQRQAHLKTIYPRQLSGPLQGKLLEMISLMIKPERILEIGTFTGYSAICLAKGLSQTGQLVTIEADEELEEMIRTNLEAAGESQHVQLLIGKALDILPMLEGSFDLIFLDADKVNYPTYYPLLRDLLSPGGFLLADNVLWNMKVVDDSMRDFETEAIRSFNQLVAQDDMVMQLLLPIRDGLFIIKKCR